MDKDLEYWTNLINDNQDIITKAVKACTTHRCITCKYSRKEAGRVEMGETFLKIEGYCVDENGNKKEPIINLKKGYCLRHKKLNKLNN